MDDELIDRLGALAHLETIRSARIEPLLLRTNMKGSANTSSQEIALPRMRPQRIHVITNICFIAKGVGTPQVYLGIMVGGQKHYLYSSTVSTAENSVNWSGQAILLEGDYVFAILESATAADDQILTANGYSMRL